MKKIVVLLLCFMALMSIAFAQTSAPQITRVAVNEKGEVELEWTPNAYPNDFDHSEVWYRNQYDPDWKKIDGSESASASSYYFKHNAGKANSRRTYYYVVNYNYVLDEFQSTEVTPIYLIACYRDGSINLTWNHVDNSWSQSEFYIYRKKDAGLWEFVETTKALTFTESPESGFTNYSYRVSYKPMDDPAASLSNITDPISFSDYKPVSPSISSLIINPEGNLILEWEKSPTNNVTSYDIYLAKNTGGWELIGHAPSPDVVRWTDNSSNDFCSIVRKYGVGAKSVCDETSTKYPDSSKSNLLFSPIIYNSCDSIALLSWMMYSDMEVDVYEIYASYDGGSSYVLVDEIEPTIFSYEYKAMTPQTCYFQIFAVHYWSNAKKQIASSCIRSVDFTFSDKPDPEYFRHVSVKGSDIEVCFEIDPNKPYLKYELERSTTGEDGSFTTIATFEEQTISPLCHLDLNMNVQTTSYYYRLKTVDTCGTIIPAVKPAQNILLQAKLTEDRIAQLEWTAYEGFINGLHSYIVHRYVNEEFDKSFSVNINAYTDIDHVVSDITLNIEYLVEAKSTISENEPDIQDIALSNRTRLQLNLPDIITFPNAFSPTQTNKIFKPTIDPSIYMSIYRLLIYNRWGELIYETELQRDGWDGRINGKIAPTGGYAYYLRIVTTNNDTYERRGSFILLN
ncbi:MAG: gliding motility-associated C-terminal domain-containing protein [Bacteroidales bacterium]|jgi:gliding motility-associated-like protein|nr:gliding motility-associated C-terminal domain-containing protein [Bacteroidales bacterium]